MVPPVASRLLEELFETISISLKCKVYRTDSDKYTLGDLLPGIRERCSKYPEIISSLDELETTLHMRNLVGAHSTSWAESFTDSEARDFGEAAQGTYESFVCGKCSTPLRTRKGVPSCSCGDLVAR